MEGLEDTVGEGLNGFIMLKEIVDNCMVRRKAILKKLEHGKRYLKIGFSQHVLTILTALHIVSIYLFLIDQHCYNHGYACVE